MKNKKVIILLLVIILAVVILGVIYILNSKKFNEDIIVIEYTTGGGFGTLADCEEISIKFNEDNRIKISAINGKLEKVISVSENDVAELKNIIKENISGLKEDLSDDDALDASYSYITINNMKFGGYAVSNKNFIEIKNKILEIVGQEKIKEFRESIGKYYEKSINNSELNNVNLLFFIIFISLGLIFVLLALILKNRDKKIIKQCNQIVKGKVVKYTLWNNNDVHFPIVEYIVDNNKYKKILKYGWVITKESSLKKIDAEVENDVKSDNLVISKNSHITTNALKEHFQIGTELDVYYNPQNPKKSYVMRFVKSPMVKVFFFTGLLFITLSVVGLAFLPN